MNLDLLTKPYPGSLLTARLQDGFELLEPPGQGSADWLLLYSMAGSGILQLGNNQRELERGTLVCCTPGSTPTLKTGTDAPGWDLVLVRFRSKLEWNPWLQWPLLAPGVGTLEIDIEADRLEIERGLMLLVGYQQGTGSRQDALAVNMLERVLLLGQKHNPALTQSHLDPRIAKVIKEIQSMPKGELDIERLAKIINVSRSRFSHLFRAQTGISPQQYVERQRMRIAMHLLANTRRQVQDIANEAGYEDAFYFSTRFKRQYGMSPRQWRKAMRDENTGSDKPQGSSPN